VCSVCVVGVRRFCRVNVCMCVCVCVVCCVVRVRVCVVSVVRVCFARARVCARACVFICAPCLSVVGVCVCVCVFVCVCVVCACVRAWVGGFGWVGARAHIQDYPDPPFHAIHHTTVYCNRE